LHDVSIRAAEDRSERDSAVQAARESASSLAAERVARQAAEKSARAADARVEEERTARQAAEVRARETAAAAGIHSSESGIKPSLAVPGAATSGGIKSPPAQSTAAPSSLASTPQPPQSAPSTGRTTDWLIPVAIVAGAGLLFFIISSFWTTWENTVSVKTDDAYVRADVTPLSTKATGVVRVAPVNDFQTVKAGQILVELRNDEYRARVEEAQQAIRQAEIKVADMKQRKEQQDARVAEADSGLENGRTTVTQADDSVAVSEATIEEAKAGIDAAKAAIVQSQAAVRAAAADVTRTALERTRQEALLANESATSETVEKAVDENERAVANLEAQKAAQIKAQAELAARQAQLAKTRQQLTTSQAEKRKSVVLVQNHLSEQTAQIMQRRLLDGEEKQLISDLASKKAGLKSAQVDLDYTIIRAPADGIVGELKVKPGQLVSAGTQVITIISAKPWVIANYRETQLVKAKIGDLAEVDIDALPGTHLKGHVESIAPASGAQFSLLPPENSSGNFTKITQRIPVKICFDEDQPKLANLRPGMSVIATIEPGSKR
jgi:membrane fusion protein, multidrug efflux system